MRTALALAALALAVAQPASAADARHGRELFVDGCSSCHGLDARGRPQQGPSLVGAGAAATDFYLSTGRMPLPDPRSQPLRAPPAYPRGQIRALVAYVGSLGGPVRTGGVSPGSVGRGCRRRGGGRDGQGACRGDDDGLGSAQPDSPVW